MPAAQRAAPPVLSTVTPKHYWRNDANPRGRDVPASSPALSPPLAQMGGCMNTRPTKVFRLCSLLNCSHRPVPGPRAQSLLSLKVDPHTASSSVASGVSPARGDPPAGTSAAQGLWHMTRVYL